MRAFIRCPPFVVLTVTVVSTDHGGQRINQIHF